VLREGAGGPFHRRKYLLGRERLDDIVEDEGERRGQVDDDDRAHRLQEEEEEEVEVWEEGVGDDEEEVHVEMKRWG
jgi:hypothetical protein